MLKLRFLEKYVLEFGGNLDAQINYDLMCLMFGNQQAISSRSFSVDKIDMIEFLKGLVKLNERKDVFHVFGLYPGCTEHILNNSLPKFIKAYYKSKDLKYELNQKIDLTISVNVHLNTENFIRNSNIITSY